MTSDTDQAQRRVRLVCAADIEMAVAEHPCEWQHCTNPAGFDDGERLCGKHLRRTR